MSDKKKYVIVDFTPTPRSDGGISVVSENWLTPRKKECFWPPHKAKSKFNKSLTEHEEPDDAWELCPLERCFDYETEDLEKARVKGKEAEDTSDLQSDNGDVLKFQRKKKVPSKLLFDHQEEHSSDDENKQSRKSKNKKIKLARPQMPDINVTEPINFNVATPTISSNATEYETPRHYDTPSTSNIVSASLVDPISDKTDDRGLLRTIMEQLVYLEEQNKQILARLEERSNKGSNTEIVDLPIDLPVTKLNDLDLLENFLDNKEQSSKLINFLSSLGGADYKRCTYKALKYVMDDQVAQKFSYFGTRGEKKPFSELRLNKIIIEAIKRNAPKNTTAEIEEGIKSWLKHAHDRLEAGKKKRKIS